MKHRFIALSKTSLAILGCLIASSVCLAGEAPAADEPHGGKEDTCPPGAHADPHASMNPDGGANAPGGDHSEHAALLKDPLVNHISSQMICPGYCGGTVLQKCSVQHRHRFAKEIVGLSERGASNNIIIASFAQKYGVHVLGFLASAAHADGEPTKGEITGVVLDASDENQPVADIDVDVVLYAGADTPKQATAKTDEKGELKFADLPIRKVTAFRLEADYDGLRYSSGWAILASDRQEAKVQLHVRHSTEDDSSISVARLHIMVDVRDGALVINEVVMAMNTGKMTVVSNDDSRGTFRISLPAGVDKASLGGEFKEDNSAVVGKNAVYSQEFRPGMKQFILQYVVPVEKAPMTFTRVLDYDTSTVDLFFPDITYTMVSNKDFDTQSRMKRRGNPYFHLSAKERKAGGTVSAEITLPMPPGNAYRRPALAIASIVVAVFVISLALGRGKKTGASNPVGSSQ